MFHGYNFLILLLKKVLCGVGEMVFKRIVTFKNHVWYEKMLCGVLDNIEKCINFAGVFFKVVKVIVRINVPYQSITHYCFDKSILNLLLL